MLPPLPDMENSRVQAAADARIDAVRGFNRFYTRRIGVLRAGLLETSLEVHLSELGAVKRALAWARPGDVLVMPVHDRAVREEVIEMLKN